MKDSLLADASAALDRLEEILGGDRPPEASEAVAVEVVPKGSPGFNLERETHDSQERGDPWGFPYGSMKIHVASSLKRLIYPLPQQFRWRMAAVKDLKSIKL